MVILQSPKCLFFAASASSSAHSSKVKKCVQSCKIKKKIYSNDVLESPKQQSVIEISKSVIGHFIDLLRKYVCIYAQAR